MPIYDYECESCGNKEEQHQLIAERDAAFCSECEYPLTRKVSSVIFHLLGPNWSFDSYSEESAPCTGNSSNPAYAEYRAKKEARMKKALKETDEKVDYHY